MTSQFKVHINLLMRVFTEVVTHMCNGPARAGTQLSYSKHAIGRFAEQITDHNAILNLTAMFRIPQQWRGVIELIRKIDLYICANLLGPDAWSSSLILRSHQLYTEISWTLVVLYWTQLRIKELIYSTAHVPQGIDCGAHLLWNHLLSNLCCDCKGRRFKHALYIRPTHPIAWMVLHTHEHFIHSVQPAAELGRSPPFRRLPFGYTLSIWLWLRVSPVYEPDIFYRLLTAVHSKYNVSLSLLAVMQDL